MSPKLGSLVYVTSNDLIQEYSTDLRLRTGVVYSVGNVITDSAEPCFGAYSVKSTGRFGPKFAIAPGHIHKCILQLDNPFDPSGRFFCGNMFTVLTVKPCKHICRPHCECINNAMQKKGLRKVWEVYRETRRAARTEASLPIQIPAEPIPANESMPPPPEIPSYQRFPEELRRERARRGTRPTAPASDGAATGPARARPSAVRVPPLSSLFEEDDQL